MEKLSELYLGLMTGTSVDAVDAALVNFQDGSCVVCATHEHPFPAALRERLLQLINEPHRVSLDELGSVNRELGLLYAAAVEILLRSANIEASAVQAIGCHGQTIRHQPDADPAFTMQIGDAATLANATGIITVADFRSADIALGGQGAPLAPLFHHWWLKSNDHAGAFINIGGIANISVITPDKPLIGFDTGPGNTLLDVWCEANTGERFDRDGRWSAAGQIIPGLLGSMLEDDYLKLQAPKSTGREYFNMDWLTGHIVNAGITEDAQNIQTTLAEFTAISIANAVKHYAPDADVWLSGGGTANADLVGRIQAHCQGASVKTCNELGIPPEWIEAAAFAWLARTRVYERTVDTPSVTGASRPAVLGAIHYPAKA